MITIEKLNFAYSKKNPLFQDLELKLAPGKIYGLLGKNGTGKSSLLKLLTGSVFPKSGSIKIEDFNAPSRRPAYLEDVFFLSENYELPAISIDAFAKANGPLYSKFDALKFKSFVQLFEVDYNSNLEKLSYGQRKKVLISFAIATNARYLFLDEPTNGLDIPSKSQFRKALLSGFKDDQTVIISTHQIRDLNQLIESVIIIEKGQIIFNKDVFELEEKLFFTRSLQETEEGSMYSEMMPGGYVHVFPNTTGDISEVELEVLFNAVIKNPSLFNQQF